MASLHECPKCRKPLQVQVQKPVVSQRMQEAIDAGLLAPKPALLQIECINPDCSEWMMTHNEPIEACQS